MASWYRRFRGSEKMRLLSLKGYSRGSEKMRLLSPKGYWDLAVGENIFREVVLASNMGPEWNFWRRSEKF